MEEKWDDEAQKCLPDLTFDYYTFFLAAVFIYGLLVRVLGCIVLAQRTY